MARIRTSFSSRCGRAGGCSRWQRAFTRCDCRRIRLDGGEVKERAERWADLRAHPNDAFRVASPPIGDFVLAWRVRGLLESGQLEGRGTQTGLQLPAEIRLRQTG